MSTGSPTVIMYPSESASQASQTSYAHRRLILSSNAHRTMSGSMSISKTSWLKVTVQFRPAAASDLANTLPSGIPCGVKSWYPNAWAMSELSRTKTRHQVGSSGTVLGLNTTLAVNPQALNTWFFTCLSIAWQALSTSVSPKIEDWLYTAMVGMANIMPPLVMAY